MIRQIREAVARHRGVELESGFTLIELLIVIVVLGILAATVIFALSGVTSQSAVAACQSDARTYETAVAAFENSASNTNNTPPANTLALTQGGYLHQAANNTHYVVAVTGDVVTDTTTGVNNGSATTGIGTTTGAVWVGPPGTTLANADATAGGCRSVS
jgi:prepilin-type N-terminal cleavage/methylation domain-containing protein